MALVFVGGGSKSSATDVNATPSSSILTPDGSTCDPIPDLAEDLIYLSTVLVGSKLYVAGGKTTSHVAKSKICVRFKI